ncbi:dipeptide/oligopeptide/nickel ABC transporter ATP-binding protein [Gracilibacillus sp. S3-1-1]|uniref:Dipeptide/oligopeptide/nickel ABC transporter ATP-binding protein n=1 Tax=Gracilibacillus pellucidus TaxID=3095368 RepID=A0ACC6M4L2_9BACI|nr:dipeptide/oligopeptide/nickel ABC transporter ATP-binding protein [Gracilibacillus sp. S3-1-1]MDX8045832.1 dipeptide/oligopeptide/nickel ABC transporter ATP-binding protein [Gracilibacillus sp. S3-1-1]
MLEVNHVYKSYSKTSTGFRKKSMPVLMDITFPINKGEWVALVGESGSGKSTLSRLMLGLEKADSGNVLIEGKTAAKWIKENRGKMSVVFQDYTSSVNPSFKVKDIINESLKLTNHSKIMESLMEKVDLPLSLLDRYPHELSGGQLQRVCIARAISTNPTFLVLDEAVSSLDVPIQAQILELLHKLKKEFGMTCLFIAHDLQTVAYLCDAVMFLHEGKIVERVETENLANVQSEYAKRLLNSVIRFS